MELPEELSHSKKTFNQYKKKNDEYFRRYQFRHLKPIKAVLHRLKILPKKGVINLDY